MNDDVRVIVDLDDLDIMIKKKATVFDIVSGHAQEAVRDDDLGAGVRALKHSLTIPHYETGRHWMRKRDLLDQLAGLKTHKPKRNCCSGYDPKRDREYELFMTYYKLVRAVALVESRDDKGYSHAKGNAMTYAYDRWMDIGMPTVSGYNPNKATVKWLALGMTLLANVCKLALATKGRASFIGNLVQAISHFMFMIYFYFLAYDEKALVIPKFVGFIISLTTAILIVYSSDNIDRFL